MYPTLLILQRDEWQTAVYWQVMLVKITIICLWTDSTSEHDDHTNRSGGPAAGYCDSKRKAGTGREEERTYCGGCTKQASAERNWGQDIGGSVHFSGMTLTQTVLSVICFQKYTFSLPVSQLDSYSWLQKICSLFQNCRNCSSAKRLNIHSLLCFCFVQNRCMCI